MISASRSDSGPPRRLVLAVALVAAATLVEEISPLGDKAVQHAWAMNGAASIAASAFSALVGITWGATGVLAFGILFYVVAAAAVWSVATKSVRPA
jgi:hypothetical protein